MKQIAKMTLVIVTLLAVSACSQPNARNQVFQDYDYSSDYASGDNQLLRMNNYY